MNKKAIPPFGIAFFINYYIFLTPPLMKLFSQKNVSKGGFGCSVTLPAYLSIQPS